VFLQCQQNVKVKWKCPTFEDYYPGDKYVDLMGVTFYNRGKGNSNRRRGTPDQIVNAAGRKTLDRLKKFDKPIFVDEVGTTAVNYTGAYDFKKSLTVYQNNS
jgi:beta-mannanase